MSLRPGAKPGGQILQEVPATVSQMPPPWCGTDRHAWQGGERREEKTEVGESGGEGRRKKRGRTGRRKGGEEESRRGRRGRRQMERRLLGWEGRDAPAQKRMGRPSKGQHSHSGGDGEKGHP